MADYKLTDGDATKVTQNDPSTEAYVNVDMDEAASVLASVGSTDRVLVQVGAAAPQTATITVLKDGLQEELDDVDWLNMGYLY